jgi:hypothetical protein
MQRQLQRRRGRVAGVAGVAAWPAWPAWPSYRASVAAAHRPPVPGSGLSGGGGASPARWRCSAGRSSDTTAASCSLTTASAATASIYVSCVVLQLASSCARVVSVRTWRRVCRCSLPSAPHQPQARHHGRRLPVLALSLQHHERHVHGLRADEKRVPVMAHRTAQRVRRAARERTGHTHVTTRA